MLKCCILTSSNESVLVDVLDVEDLLDGLQAGSSVSLSLEDWISSCVGGSIDDSLLEVTLEVVIEAKELLIENESSKRNGGEDGPSVEGRDEMENDVFLGTGSCWVLIARATGCTFRVGIIIVFIEPGDEFVGSISERVGRDDHAKSNDHAESGSLDGQVQSNWGLDTNTFGLSFGQSVVRHLPEL